MSRAIIDEYTLLLQKRVKLELALAELPQGYISKKSIKGNTYNYLQARCGYQVKSRYLKVSEVEEIKDQIDIRNLYKEELSLITNRLLELEMGAELIDSSLARRMQQLQISIGMDALSKEERVSCVAFAETMTSIEGISPSDDTKEELNHWMNGNTTFLSAFENTLKRYGFKVEVE